MSEGCRMHDPTLRHILDHYLGGAMVVVGSMSLGGLAVSLDQGNKEAGGQTVPPQKAASKPGNGEGSPQASFSSIFFFFF